MKTRMQPIGGAWAKLPRLVRDLAQELGKKIDLDMTGQETELDRQVLELIRDPLTHMIRNAATTGWRRRTSAGRPASPRPGASPLQRLSRGRASSSRCPTTGAASIPRPHPRQGGRPGLATPPSSTA